ncbi:MAG: hypothetical protein V4481_04175 [Patescibacteria group bacterium]
MDSSLREFCARTGADFKQLSEKYDPKRRIGRKEKTSRFETALEALYWQAVRSRKLGISWRKFHVGCVAYGYRPDVVRFEDHWKVFYGMNSKVAETERNTCAEPICLTTALAWGCTEIIGLVVVGETQKDEKGVTHPTLRPCEHCRRLMKSHPLIKPHTIIVTANPPPRRRTVSFKKDVKFEVHTFTELIASYGES